MKKTIEERVDRIEKIFWVVGVIAVIFGVSGAWGYNVLQSSRTQLSDLDKKVEDVQNRLDEASNLAKNVESEINNRKDEAIRSLKNEEDMAIDRLKRRAYNLVSEEANKKFKDSVVYDVWAGKGRPPWITKLGKNLSVTLPVTKGDIVQATFAGSAWRSNFYYRIVEKSQLSVTEAPLFAQIIQNQNDYWRSVVASRVFEVTRDGKLTLAVEFIGAELKDPKVKVAGARLIATKVAFGK